MISQQAICKRLGDRFDVFGVKEQDVFLIKLLDEDVLTITAAMIDRVVGIIK